MATDTPAALLLTLADRLDTLPPSAVPPRDNLTMAHAAGVLRRLAPRVASDDPAVVAKAAGQIRSMRWSGPSAPAALWGEAVEAVAGMGGPAGAAPSPMDPRAALQRALEEAYRRGVGDGTAAERGRIVKQLRGWLANGRDGMPDDPDGITDWLATEVEESGDE